MAAAVRAGLLAVTRSPAQPGGRGSYLDLILLLWLCALVATAIALFMRGPADDSYIVARYAHNLTRGHGLVFNAGERINALTSPAGLAVIVALSLLFPDPVRAWQWLAALLVVACLVALARRMFAVRPAQLALLGVTLASPFVLLWTVGGLETPLLLVLLAWVTSLALAPPPATRARTAAVIALATLAVFTRYDAVLFAGPLALAALYRRRTDPFTWLAAATGGCAFGAWLVFCQAYYGDLLPTSFYVKFPRADFAGQLALGADYLLSFAVLALLPLAWLWRYGAKAPSTDVVAMRGMTAAPRTGPRVPSELWLALALALAYGLFAGTVHMMYAYRFFVPYLPALWMCMLQRAAPGLDGPPGRWRWGSVAALAMQTLLLVVVWRFSMNFNLALLVQPQTAAHERHEFSTLGARYGVASDRAVRQQAADMLAHWSARAQRPPRVAVETGGLLPFFAPDSYVLERLVSYRRYCTIPHERAADYWQVFRLLPAGADGPRPMPPGWQPVSVHNIEVTDIHQQHQRLAVELWFQPAPDTPALPPTADGACSGAPPAP